MAHTPSFGTVRDPALGTSHCLSHHTYNIYIRLMKNLALNLFAKNLFFSIFALYLIHSPSPVSTPGTLDWGLSLDDVPGLTCTAVCIAILISDTFLQI